MTALEKIKSLDYPCMCCHHKRPWLVKAFNLMREIAIKNHYEQKFPADSIDDEFEERMKELEAVKNGNP